jgi:hypothetical protein
MKADSPSMYRRPLSGTAVLMIEARGVDHLQTAVLKLKLSDGLFYR